MSRDQNRTLETYHPEHAAETGSTIAATDHGLFCTALFKVNGTFCAERGVYYFADGDAACASHVRILAERHPSVTL